MTTKERIFIIAILAAVVMLVAIDLIMDFREGAAMWHIIIEGVIAVIATIGVLYLTYDIIRTRYFLKEEQKQVKVLREESHRWRRQLRKHIEGLTKTINEQMEEWGLTPSEKEIAFMLLKGLSIKEIAKIRKTSEKTARAQCVNIYEKSGLSGRSELSAFFIEDLFECRQENNTDE